MIGIAMEPHEVPGLADFNTCKDDDAGVQAAEYYLQFLWRDLTSDFDVIGPHFSSSSTMDCSFTVKCLQDTVDAFQSYGFKLSTLLFRLFARTYFTYNISLI